MVFQIPNVGSNAYVLTIKPILETLQIDGFAFDVELLMSVKQQGLRTVEVPIDWVHIGESRVRPIIDPVIMLRDLIRLRYRRIKTTKLDDKSPSH